MRGELCLAGSQVTQGYLNNPEKTESQFVRLPSDPLQVWYRTGDLAREDARGCFYYLGRIDNQVQIRGFRVELQEIDHILRQASGTELAVAVAWPIQDGRADSVYGFVCSPHPLEERVVLAACARHLPDYMLPQRIFFLPEMPLNANGKIDRGALTQRLQELPK